MKYLLILVSAISLSTFGSERSSFTCTLTSNGNVRTVNVGIDFNTLFMEVDLGNASVSGYAVRSYSAASQENFYTMQNGINPFHWSFNFVRNEKNGDTKLQIVTGGDFFSCQKML